MKKTFALIVSALLVLVLSLGVCAEVTLPAYNGDWKSEHLDGVITPVKHELVFSGRAGAFPEDDNHWYISAAKGSTIPVIDGKCESTEGYTDFENYEDYLYIGLNRDSGTNEIFESWYNEVKNWDLVVKTCWDGTYLYCYFEYSIENYVCNPSSGSNLWQWNCIQFGVANPDAIGNERSETGYGITSKGVCYTASWGGTYSPVDGEDYMGTMKKKGGTTYLTHEFRVNLLEALGVTELKSGNQIRMGWAIMSDNTLSCNRGLCFGLGISFEHYGKEASHFPLLTLVGDVEQSQGVAEKYYTPDAMDKELEYNATSSLFFADITETNDFISNGDTVTATYHGEDEIKYMTLTSSEAKALYYSQKRFPKGLWATGDGASDVCPTYAVIRYRTSTEGSDLGMNFVNVNMRDVTDPETGEVLSVKGFLPENAVYPLAETAIQADGEWHYAIYPLAGSPAWLSIIESIGLEVTGSIDVEGIRFFGWDPSEKYDPNYVAVGDDDDDDDDDETVPSTPVASSEESKPADKPAKKGGCKSTVMAGSFLVISAMLGGYVLTKKRR